MKRYTSFPASARPAPSGFALFEVLICILVLTVGMIGAALMQLHASRTTDQSNLHDNALALAAQIADELRATDWQTPQSAGNLLLQFRYKYPDPSPGPAGCYGDGNNCSHQQLAAQSVSDWVARAQSVLPNGRIEICRDPATLTGSSTLLGWCPTSGSLSVDIPVSVKIGWQERDASGGDVVNSSPQLAILVSPFSR